jgi:hypothetical protein
MARAFRITFCLLLFVVACGDTSRRTQGVIDPTGGEVCLDGRRVCVIAASGVVSEATTFKIDISTEKPAAALGESFDISVSGKTSARFEKRLTIEFSTTEAETLLGSIDPSLLRIFTKHDGDWEALENLRFDRVRRVLSAETSRFSPFVLLRADRLPDGGIPPEFDGGMDGVIPDVTVPPRPDSGKPVVDAGKPQVDSGTPDAGPPAKPDSGMPDAGVKDAGVPDAGVKDAGVVDAGVPVVDAGQPGDAGGDGDAGQVPDASDP